MRQEVSRGARSWTAEELRAEVARLGPWFHAIDLGRGVTTKQTSLCGEPVDHPAGAWRTISRALPANLDGSTVLDVGCNGGFYMVEAKRRGAGRVLGIDAARHHVQQAQFVRSALGLDFEVRRRSVYDLDPDDIGRFDITLALGLIYHCKHPVLALERLYAVTRRMLVLESAVAPAGSLPAPFNAPLGDTATKLYPVALAENPPNSAEAAYNWFLPTPESLVVLLRAVGFADVRTIAVADERVVLVATKPDRPGTNLAARLTFIETPARVTAGASFVARVRVENRGSESWPATGSLPSGSGPVHVGAHLLAADDEETVLDWDWARGTLPNDLVPGDQAVVELELVAPASPGQYDVECDLVAEGLAWFADLGSQAIRYRITVDPTSSPASA